MRSAGLPAWLTAGWQPQEWTTESITHSYVSPRPSHCLLVTGKTRDTDRAGYSPQAGCMVGLGSWALSQALARPLYIIVCYLTGLTERLV